MATSRYMLPCRRCGATAAIVFEPDRRCHAECFLCGNRSPSIPKGEWERAVREAEERGDLDPG